jgi:DNA polymerase III delta prime subunit
MILHPDTEATLKQIVAKPSHAILLVAPSGTGKRTLARHMAAQLLQTTDEKLDSHSFFKILTPVDGKAISIESVRDVTHFLMLRTTGEANVSRVVLIEHAGSMTVQAQNALLKTIEEPPLGTVLILTATSELDMLPTICSRVQTVTLRVPPTDALRSYFAAAGFAEVAINRALMMSDGLPGLTQALLSDDESHPLVAATARARDILQKSTFERLLLIDDLIKQKQHFLDVLFIIQRIAEINLQKAGSSTSTARRWHTVLTASHDAYGQITASGQAKLVALQFMLSI